MLFNEYKNLISYFFKSYITPIFPSIYIQTVDSKT